MSSRIWLKSSSMSMSPNSPLSFSLDSLPPELRGDPLVMLQAVPPDPYVMGERREYGFYGLEHDGALRPGGQVPLLSRRTFGLLLNYVGIGAMYGGINSALVPFLSGYLQLKPYQVRAAGTVINTAWTFKVFGGFLTDSVQICGYRRKPYLLTGWVLCFGSLLFLGTTGVNETGGTDEAWRYMLFMTLATVGYFLANVAADALVVEIAQRESLSTRGHTQSRAMWQLLMFELMASFCLTIDSNASSGIEANWVDVEKWPKTIATVVWGLAYIAGLFVTHRFLLRQSWGHLFCVATVWTVGVDVVTVACTVFEVLRNQYFWLYMQILAAPAVALRFLILLFPIVELAPRGLEGTTYGLVITCRNLAIPLGVTAYKAIDSYFSISDKNINADSDPTRLQVTYTYLIAWALQLLSLAFIGLLPHQKLEVQQLRYYGGYSTSAGWLVVVTLLSVLIYTTTANILSLFESTACLRVAGGTGC
ncbi:hypothetical protein BBO99_00004356 [Phytophthora kernoviae]|uniref:Major facilitator superfamily associated domain-containing protein n=1 Tax=Phytophthora kernoviae TaxID=325452 RepID=A0A3R7J6K8_9STRA|nr:hypothetical protein JM16_004205 [Phytophthora kernoviae]KAG2523019.1 hypothetical protein JM18_003603 [Phytophthora kernoviae]RLN10793.1 hypothetical protein BBI17_004542 [Phytophthora kernoviae]RLN80616.1 hypothetical protein BBO99_00004356 [Phytophthora kernoviae]